MLDELKKIGLTENEAKTYLALLELGSTTAQKIAKKSGVKRVTTYVQIETLMKRGLVSSFEKEPQRKNGATKTFFRAENPEYLKNIVDREKKAVDERGVALKNILPELGVIFASAGERPSIRFFEGVGGLRTMQDEFLKTNAKLVESVSSLDDVLKVFPTHHEEYTPRRVKLGIASKLIYTNSRGAVLKEKDEPMLRESRFIPRDKFPFSCDIAIYGESAAIHVFREKLFGVIIESKEIADSMRSLFKLAWEGAEKYKQK